jgi:hypothetical protein
MTDVTETTTPATAPRKKTAAKKKAAKKANGSSQSKLVKKSWTDPKIAKARSARNGVKAAGKQYGSVREAFAALCPDDMGRHITFRGKLKKSKRETFTTGKGKAITFVLTDAVSRAGAEA